MIIYLLYCFVMILLFYLISLNIIYLALFYFKIRNLIIFNNISKQYSLDVNNRYTLTPSL
nr:MAG TPA: hypothetical protein [Caudoviricetes sp.]